MRLIPSKYCLFGWLYSWSSLLIYYVFARKSIDARLDDNSGSSGSPGGGHFATPTEKAAQRRADMRREEQERRRRVAVSNTG